VIATPGGTNSSQLPADMTPNWGPIRLVKSALTSDAERDELWPQIAAQAPHFAKWRARIGRTLPLGVLTARSSGQRQTG
jgi:hypothetical protein